MIIVRLLSPEPVGWLLAPPTLLGRGSRHCHGINYTHNLRSWRFLPYPWRCPLSSLFIYRLLVFVWPWIVWLPVRSLRTVMVSKFFAAEGVGIAFLDFREHRRIPFQPGVGQLLIDIWKPLLQVRALQRIFDHVEQKGVV